ncbi:MAG: recombinase family protein [Solirubrobacteraceae bacterium]
MSVVASNVAGKVTAGHLARTAFLYVRQSTLRQVLHNTESTQRQYALRRRAIALGWPQEQIVVIDTDQGQSGASAADREGFQRLVAEVGLGKAGIVLGLEVSRLARNNADWHRLLEICGLSGTLICDEDGLYDPADFNDRLLLGLKGTMSEAELHFIRARLQGGILSKARRGELQMPLPVGLVYDPAGQVVLDPDTSVQNALNHVFATFARTGSARAVVHEFTREGLLFPARIRKGHLTGELAWSELEHWRVLRTLHNPRYAGAFAYGRRKNNKTPDGKVTSRQLPREQWTALIPNTHPGYITFEQFEHNQQTLASNARAHGNDRAGGPAREGPALLQGLVVCGRCGNRMSVQYHQRRGTLIPDYRCVRENIQRYASACQTIPGQRVDEAISQLLLDTVTPLALEVALSVQTELEQRADEADQLRKSHVERARHHAEQARRRYLAVDPDNRLVADTLEADWNDKLRQLQAAQDDYDRDSANAKAQLTEQHKTRIRQLATDFPRLWSDPATPARERKRIARLLIEDVTLNRADQIHLHVRFRGGQTSSLTLPLPTRVGELRKTPAEVIAQIDQLLDQHTEGEIAMILNQQGHRSFDGKPFTGYIVKCLGRNHHLGSHQARLHATGMLTLAEITEQLGVHHHTIKAWRRAGLLTSRKANDRNEQLYDPPDPSDPRLVKHSGRRLADREHIQTHPGGAL